jgi:predicted nucleic acid-binding protein
MSVGDAIIAATALRYGLDICTNNVADFAKIIGLKTYNPTSM